ncbi:MAG: dUTP diphosphatase, partial [Nanoarchaeota archaeon]
MGLTIKCRRLTATARLPAYGRLLDAGLDLCADEDVVIPVRSRMPIRTGLAIELPQGTWGCFRDRSGLALRNGLTLLAGVLDSTYRGEIVIVLLNTSDQPYQV